MNIKRPTRDCRPSYANALPCLVLIFACELSNQVSDNIEHGVKRRPEWDEARGPCLEYLIRIGSHN